MESTDLDRTASEIQSSVDDLKTEVIYFKEALQKLLEAAQDGIDELEDLWYPKRFQSQQNAP